MMQLNSSIVSGGGSGKLLLKSVVETVDVVETVIDRILT
jgi:hypothetical protein